MTMRFVPVTVPGAGVSSVTIDTSQCASLLNRRFYRQGLNWAVASIKILVSTGDPDNRAQGYVAVSKLPTTWIMSNAYEKGFRVWQKMNNEAMQEAESVRPRFLDYKIFADATHHSDGVDDNLLPLSLSGGVATAGEWESSKMRIPVGVAAPGDTTDREIIAVGANYPGVGASGVNAVSLIEGYAASRGLPSITDPNVPDDAQSADGTTPANWFAATFNEGTEQTDTVLEDLINDNNQAPYPFENGEIPGAPGTYWPDTFYPGGANQLSGLAFHDDSYITSTSIGGTTRLNGGLFPCGLIRIYVVNTTLTDGDPPLPVDFEYSVQVELVPGTHRGYLAESMLEM